MEKDKIKEWLKKNKSNVSIFRLEDKSYNGIDEYCTQGGKATEPYYKCSGMSDEAIDEAILYATYLESRIHSLGFVNCYEEYKEFKKKVIEFGS